MPSRYHLTSSPDAVRTHFGYHNEHRFPPRDVIVPGEPVMIVRRGHGGRREAHLVRWGLIPPWARDFDKLGMLNTARVETVSEKPSFRGAMRHKRCLVPATGFFIGRRWIARPAEHSVGGVLGFAGLYEEWMGADGSEIDSMAILTTAAAGTTLSRYGGRIPVTIAPQDYAQWLDCRGVTAAEAAQLLSKPSTTDLQVIENSLD